MFMLSVHNTIRLFILDGELMIVTDYIEIGDGWIFTPYTLQVVVLQPYFGEQAGITL